MKLDKYDAEYSKEFFCCGTCVYKNKLGLTTEDALTEMERKITSLHMAEIMSSNTRDVIFDYSFLKNIHKRLFSDLFFWAGEERKINMKKGDSIFCPASEIRRRAVSLFFDIKNLKSYTPMSRTDFIEQLSVFMNDVNELHPFIDGNGRSKRVFFSLWARAIGYQIDYSRVSKEEIILSDIEAMRGNRKRLIAVLDAMIARE